MKGIVLQVYNFQKCLNSCAKETHDSSKTKVQLLLFILKSGRVRCWILREFQRRECKDKYLVLLQWRNPKVFISFYELGNHRSLCDLINKVSFLSHSNKGNEEITVTEDLEELDTLVIHRCCFAKGKQAIIGGQLVIVLLQVDNTSNI